MGFEKIAPGDGCLCTDICVSRNYCKVLTLNPPLLQSFSSVITEDSFKSCLWLRAIEHGYELLDFFSFFAGADVLFLRPCLCVHEHVYVCMCVCNVPGLLL